MRPNVQNAISILAKVQESCGREFLAYWVLPNVILTMCGVRAFCDGVFWSDNKKVLAKWSKEITYSSEVIKTHSSLLSIETNINKVRKNETYASYDLIFGDGLNYIVSHSSLLGTDRLNLSTTAINFQDLQKQIYRILRSRTQYKKYSKENIYHMVFGVLLGYPDSAIVDSVKLWEDNDPFAEKLIDADIRGAGYYRCPQPIYNYPRHLINDPEINSHEKMWSKLLSDYYHSDFHKELEKNPKFQAKMKELGNLNY